MVCALVTLSLYLILYFTFHTCAQTFGNANIFGSVFYVVWGLWTANMLRPRSNVTYIRNTAILHYVVFHWDSLILPSLTVSIIVNKLVWEYFNVWNISFVSCCKPKWECLWLYQSFFKCYRMSRGKESGIHNQPVGCPYYWHGAGYQLTNPLWWWEVRI